MRKFSPILVVLASMVLTACASVPTVEEVPTAVGIVDPLSMPARPTVALPDVPLAASCGGCHPQQFAEWSGSRHAFAMKDPVFQKLVGARQTTFGGLQDKFCVQCHSIAGVRSQDVSPGFEFAKLAPASMDGVNCWSCHAAESIARVHNAGLNMATDTAMRGNLSSPTKSLEHGFATAPFLKSPEFCGSCHEVTELSGLPLERPFAEWQASPAFAKQQTCADCHMPTYTATAAVGGPVRQGLRSHRFVGLDPPGAREAADPSARAVYSQERDAMLATAAGVSIAPGVAKKGENLVVAVTVENRIGGHSLPTGSTFIRQCWLEVRATDASGKVLYETGTLDKNGDLRDRWSSADPYGDADLVSFSSSFVDAKGQPTLFPWLATEHRRNALRAGEKRTFTLFVPVAQNASGPVQVTARVRLRTYPPFLLHVLALDALLPEVILADLATAATAVGL